MYIRINFDPNWSGSEWKGESNATASSDTGPTGPHSGDDYIYLEASNLSNSSDYYLTSGSINSNNVSISFYYHIYGTSIGSSDYLKLESYDGSSWTDDVTDETHASSELFGQVLVLT